MSNERIVLTVTPRGMEHMHSMFADEAEKARGEVAEIERLLSLLGRLARDITLHVESDGRLARATLTYEQTAVITRALEARLNEEEARADRLEEAAADCSRSLATMKEEKQ